MRKQYHFQPSDRGRLAWDVERLIQLSAGLPRRQVPLAEIREYEEVYWFDGELYFPTCRSVVEHMQLIQEVDPSYPIILSATGRVMDGMHRVARAHLDGRSTIEAVQFAEDPEPDYVGVRADELPY